VAHEQLYPLGIILLEEQGTLPKKIFSLYDINQEFTRQDYQQLIDWIDEEKLMVNWTGFMFNFPITEDDLDWYIENSNDPHYSDVFIYKAVDTSTGETVGHISLGGISKKNRAGRISRVLISKDARGKGYCQEMMMAILKIGFDELKLHRISLGVYNFNDTAIHCYEKCGFKREGVARDILYYEGEYWSMLEMSMLEDEWEQIKKKK
jgi:RimJ/RimL family protein N-acetyltransferase